MRIKSIVAGVAIAFAAAVGSASADEQFSTLEGIAAEAMTPQEMGVVKGMAPGDLTITLPEGADPIMEAGGVAGGSVVPTTGVTGGKTAGIVTIEAPPP